MAKKRGRPIGSKKKVRRPKKVIEEIKAPDPPKEVQIPEIPEIEDRMLRYSPRTSQTSMRNKPRCCPECQAMPVVTIQRRRYWTAYRCRKCGHRWDMGTR